MNNFQQNLAVNTLLKLDAGSAAARPRAADTPERPTEPFRQLLDEQRLDKQRLDKQRLDKERLDEQRSAATAQDRSAGSNVDASADKRPLSPRQKDSTSTQEGSATPTDEARTQPETKGKDTDHELTAEGVPVQDSGKVDEAGLLAEERVAVPGEEMPILADDTPEPDQDAVSTLTEGLPSLSDEAGEQELGPAADSAIVETVAPGEDAVAVTSVTDQSALLRSASERVDDTVPEALAGVRDYRLNAAGKPLEVREVEVGLEQPGKLKVDVAAMMAKDGSSAAVPTEAKASAARQLSNLVAQLASGQATTSSEQMLKELAARNEAGGRQSGAATASPVVSALTGKPQSALVNTPLNPLQAQIKNAIGQPQWQAEVAERVALMASKNIKSAEIQLDPPELGPLQVKVSVNQEHASVVFASQHAQVREALDQTAFRLREMLQQEGMTQVDVDVSDQSFAQEQGEQKSGGEASSRQEGESDASQETVVSVKTSRSLIDHFV